MNTVIFLFRVSRRIRPAETYRKRLSSIFRYLSEMRERLVSPCERYFRGTTYPARAETSLEKKKLKIGAYFRCLVHVTLHCQFKNKQLTDTKYDFSIG